MMRRIICGPCGSSWSSVDYTANRWSLSGEAPCVLENVSKHLCSVFETLIEGCSTCTWLCKYMSTVLVSCWCSWTLISQMFECWIQWICISIFFFLIELSSETTMVHRTTISVKNIYELFFFLPVRLCLCRPSTTSRYSSSSTMRWSWWKRRRPKSGLKGKDTVNILNLARSIIYGKFFFPQLCIDLI